jgi:hypothetical protein
LVLEVDGALVMEEAEDVIEKDGKTVLDADEREQESRPLLFLKKNPATFLLACAL